MERHLVAGMGNIYTVYYRRLLRRGVPQGGILSPLIWSLIFDELIEEIQRTTFTDDALIHAQGDDVFVLLEHVQTALNAAQAWTQRNGLTLSPTKTVLMVLTLLCPGRRRGGGVAD